MNDGVSILPAGDEIDRYVKTECSLCGRWASVRWVVDCFGLPDAHERHNWWCCSKHCARQAALLVLTTGQDCKGISNAEWGRLRRRAHARV